MGHQIIKQPDGRLCVFSSIVDEIIVADATAAELGDFYAEREAERARSDVKRLTDAVLAGNPRLVYHRFVMTYPEAVAKHRNGGGDPDMILQAN